MADGVIYSAHVESSGPGRGAAWLARAVRVRKVAGSNPAAPTTIRPARPEEQDELRHGDPAMDRRAVSGAGTAAARVLGRMVGRNRRMRPCVGGGGRADIAAGPPIWQRGGRATLDSPSGALSDRRRLCYNRAMTRSRRARRCFLGGHGRRVPNARIGRVVLSDKRQVFLLGCALRQFIRQFKNAFLFSKCAYALFEQVADANCDDNDQEKRIRQLLVLT